MRFPTFSQVGLGTVLAVAVAAGVSVKPASATEGYFQHGYGAVSKALAGSGVAYSQDAMAQALNPAGLVNVGNEFTLGLSIFSPDRKFTTSGSPGLVPAGSHESENDFFFVPDVAINYRLDAVSSVGVAIYGNGGMNTEYGTMPGGAACAAATGVFCNGKTGVNLSQLFLQPTYARKIGSRVSVGAGLILATQFFEAKGLQLFSGQSTDSANLTNRDTDTAYGIGGRIGAQVDIGGGVSAGIAYQLRTYMSEFDHYRGLFAEQGDFDVPPALQAGVAWKTAAGITLLADFKRIWYSQVNSVGNPFASSNQLGPDNGRGFGWDDINIYKIGVQYQATPKLILRAGYSHNDNPIGPSEVLFNILAPGVIEDHFTAGFEYEVTPSSSLVAAAMYAPSSSVTGPNAMSAGQNITLEMEQYEVTFGWKYKF